MHVLLHLTLRDLEDVLRLDLGLLIGREAEPEHLEGVLGALAPAELSAAGAEREQVESVSVSEAL